MRAIDADALILQLTICQQNGMPTTKFYAIDDVIHYVKTMPTIAPEIKTGKWISEHDMADKLTRLINEFEMILSDIREKEVNDSVCGLCEYDADHGMDGYANECPGFERDDCFRLKDEYRKEWMSLKC